MTATIKMQIVFPLEPPNAVLSDLYISSKDCKDALKTCFPIRNNESVCL